MSLSFLKKEILNKTRTTLTSMVNKSLGTSDDQWLQVEDAVNNVQLSHYPELRFVGERLLVLKKSGSSGELEISKISGGEDLRHFTKEVKFKTGMINDHMPWAYNKLFSGKSRVFILKNIPLLFSLPGFGSGEGAEKISLEALDRKYCEAKKPTGNLYPDLSKLEILS